MNSTLLRIRESSLEGINVSLKISLLTSLQSRLFHPSLGQPKARPKSPCGYARLERPHPSQLQAYLTTAPPCPTLQPLPPASDAGEATGPSVPAFLPHFEKGECCCSHYLAEQRPETPQAGSGQSSKLKTSSQRMGTGRSRCFSAPRGIRRTRASVVAATGKSLQSPFKRQCSAQPWGK